MWGKEKGNKANHRLGSTFCSAININSRYKPLSRIRREELKARNKRNIYNRDEDSKEEIIYDRNDPDRRATDMEIEDAIS